MWLTPAFLCVLYVETYQEDVPHPFVFPFRSKQASAYPNYNVLVSKLNAVPLHANIGPEKLSNYVSVERKREKKPSEDSTQPSYVLLKLKTEVCKKYSPCSTILDKKIKSHLAAFAKEVKTLELFVNIAKSYATVSREFSKVTQTGDVVTYLLNNKDKIKEFILDNVNYVDHIDENYLGCS
ncbi:hypothetical protein HF086_014564 [Spodoptera exigua]|uniref:Uncharacterized protein n=1 Tax=Spodoptera exigua TaxID=7107 RepID=A0A922SA58_SPOEX|nr:hypothetical protein HF086_014564 [Spodoptera exigua]